MKYVLLFVSIFCVLFSCNNEDDAENSVYSSEYQRHIIYKDSISSYEGNGVVKISQKNNSYNFDFEVQNGKVASIKDIKMEMTGANTLRNIDWTPTRLIMMTKDSLNISYNLSNQTWRVNGLVK
ncbi:hypothetical protein [Empedobacter sedimenti]|uniref:hypothetical protein n=1 Tax=Empedobacter sedimenti TaxID=3042610 RepID=UPI0024A69649|nr:hypothetical protein [Empedobacter sedimenti]